MRTAISVMPVVVLREKPHHRHLHTHDHKPGRREQVLSETPGDGIGNGFEQRGRTTI